MNGTVDWDAAAYDRLADPQEEWAGEVVARLVLEGTKPCSTRAAAAGA